MHKEKLWIVLVTILMSGCAMAPAHRHMDADRTAQAFFDDLQVSRKEAAYNLLGKGLSQRISFSQFEDFMQTLREEWGRIESDQTVVMPFHKRVGEQNFIPLRVSADQIKRYVFNVKFEHAEMNFDLTLAPQEDGHKIVWFSIWGSQIYLTPKVKEKIEELFSGPDDPEQV